MLPLFKAIRVKEGFYAKYHPVAAFVPPVVVETKIPEGTLGTLLASGRVANLTEKQKLDDFLIDHWVDINLKSITLTYMTSEIRYLLLLYVEQKNNFLRRVALNGNVYLSHDPTKATYKKALSLVDSGTFLYNIELL